MPFPKLFKRHRTTSVIDDQTRGMPPSSYSHLPLPIPDLRSSSSMPQLLVPQNGLPRGFNAPPPARNDFLQVSIPSDAKLLPPTPSSPQAASPTRSEVSDDMGGMWRGINDRAVTISKTEKIINKISDTASGVVNAESSSDGVFGLVKTVIANDEVKAIGNSILEGVPAIMNALETLTEIHPFLKAAYLPFKLIYSQEVTRRENDHKRTTLFEKIKDVMLILLELKSIGTDDTRTTPEGKPVLSRMASICKDMKKDIEECYNILNAQEKRGVGIKFLKAAAWNKQLASYATRFTNRREDLTFTLSMRTVVTMEEMNSNMKKMMDMFSTMMSPQERDMGRWISQNGGDKAVLASDQKCLAMLQYQETLITSTGPATGHTTENQRTKPLSNENNKKNDAKNLAALRKEYREDIQGIIQENLESYSKRFEMVLNDLGKELGSKIQHQGDRLIKYLKGGPHQRIKDKMVFHVWKDQGWKGSAKTRPLVLALRDYFVERVEHSKLAPGPENPAPKRRISSVPKEEDDNDDDPETEISVPLPDSWMSAYLQVKRLRYLQQALDPDSSGFTTISEVNAFAYARPEDWSFPRWISYWVIGWQIYATKYCVEIEELFAQMMLLKFQIGLRMPGNVRYVNDYIENIWQHVTALTSSIERYDSPPPWLEEKFATYIQSQETTLKERLEKIQYDIDAVETVSLILRSERIESAIFILLALLMRRHVAKMHLCLKQEVDAQELADDFDTVTFLELKEQFQHQGVADLKQIFEWLSCGLFKNYWEWQHWLQPKYFMENEMTAWSSVDTVQELDPSELKPEILVYSNAGSKSKPEELSSESTNTTLGPSSSILPDGLTAAAPPPAEPASPVPTIEALATDKVSIDTPGTKTLVLSKPSPSDAEMSITGTWYGFHWTETQKPFLPMTTVNFKCGDRQPESETKTAISGDGVSYNAFTLTGRLDSYLEDWDDRPDGSFEIYLDRTYTDDGTWIGYYGTFLPDQGIMYGNFTHSRAEGSFLFKKIPASVVMCARPLVTSALNAKELWSFALNAVINDIRRKKPGVLYLCERMTSVHRVLTLRYGDDRDRLNEAETAEYSKLLMTFSFEEMSEVRKLYHWYDRVGDLQPAGYSCDACHTSLVRTRVVCMDCVSTDKESGCWSRTVDFCGKPECIATESLPNRTDVMHLPSHTMVQLRDLFMLKDYMSLKQRAGYSIEYACGIYTDPKVEPSWIDLPPSPAVDNPASSDSVSNGDSIVANSTGVCAVVEASLTPATIIVSEKSTKPPSLPQLDTNIFPPLASNPNAEKYPTTATTNLLSTAVTPTEEFVDEDSTLDCVFCHNRVVTPCWYCNYCYNAFVCDSCEKMINDLVPWDYQKRYRSEMGALTAPDDTTHHTIRHTLVRLTRAKAEGGKPDGNGAADSTTSDLASPQGQWEQVEKRIQELVNARFEELEKRLTNGLGNIERLLNSIAAQGTPP
ncbi:hypothetical protein DFH08DRAFT_943570 [Mycena albidolilacea]|uniref:Uncharacterized protein n=1 Tax=Mycena albidolilacea TaxID=1033008 RepID=A0AAD7EDL3_9AGAR|nr:hypothetical protein DFH08DRAFT_943570 [Mycena albidolilacea]